LNILGPFHIPRREALTGGHGRLPYRRLSRKFPDL